MKNFWNNERTIFHQLPEQGKFKIEQFLLAIAFIVTMFVGIGQLPLGYVIVKTDIFSNGNMVDFMQNLSVQVGRNNLLILLIIPFVLTLLAIFFAIRYIHKSVLLPFFTAREKIDWSRVLWAFGTWSVLMIVMLLFTYFRTDSLVWNYNSDTFVMLFLICFLLIPLQITCEELLFRSYFFKGLSFMKKPILQVVFCGIFFGLMHAGNPEIDMLGDMAIVFYIWTGIFLGLLAHFDNGIELSIGYHAANNIFAALVVTTDWQVFQTDALWIDTAPPTIGWDMGLTLFIWQPLMLLFFNWKYQWGIQLGKKSN